MAPEPVTAPPAATADGTATLEHDPDADFGAKDNEEQSQSSKAKSLLAILKRLVGVKDLAAM